MSENYNLLLEKLKILKENYHAVGMKLELETEIISTQEIDLAQKLTQESGLDLTLKLSGSSAVSDIFLAKALNVKSLLSPMIESAYALEKFYSNVKHICENDEKKLLFNIETIVAYENLDKILSTLNIDKFSTIVFGRNDFCGSLGKNANYCDSPEIFEYIKNTLDRIKNTNLTLTIGGNISRNSLDFLKNINDDKFIQVETRKITFDKKVVENDFDLALKNALEFELLWLESKSFKNPLDKERQVVLKERMLR